MRQMRLGGGVLRWHTTPPLRDQSVAEHSWGVAAICAHLWPRCSRNLLLAALYHDVPESMVGDTPSPVKWKHPRLAAELEEVEHTVLTEMNLHLSLDETEKLRLKIADMMELLWFCVEEERRGNRNLKRSLFGG